MANFYSDDHFKQYSQSLQLEIMGYGEKNEDLNKEQKKQIETLIKLEKQFRILLKKHRYGEQAYNAFMDFILKEKKSVLAARPYFRERNERFAGGISLALQNRDFKKLSKFAVNYTFVNFILKCRKWGRYSVITKKAKEISDIREKIIILNMPLAISRARIFRKSTPDSHLSYMDINQIASEGLINAVDKFVLPYSPVFRGVIIGRIVGDLIDNYSETMLHFYPSDKRKIYRANKSYRLKTEEKFEELAKEVNKGTALPQPTTASEIQQLMAASSGLYSLESKSTVVDDSEETTLRERYSDSEENRPDLRVEKNEIFQKMFSSIKDLSIIEQKILKLKGIELED